MYILNRRKLGISLIVLALLLIFVLAVIKAETAERDAFLCSAVHSNPNIDNASCPVHERDISSWFIGAFGLTFLILVGGVYMSFSYPVKREEAHKKFKEFDLDRLDPEEKTIYDLLKENEGSMYQSDIVKETSLSKVQVTRILDKLEHKGVLERKRRGMTNIIVLK